MIRERIAAEERTKHSIRKKDALNTSGKESTRNSVSVSRNTAAIWKKDVRKKLFGLLIIRIVHKLHWPDTEKSGITESAGSVILQLL